MLVKKELYVIAANFDSCRSHQSLFCSVPLLVLTVCVCL